MPNHCRTCLYWDWQPINDATQLKDLHEGSFGYCRRHAPHSLVKVNSMDSTGNGRSDTVWPETAANEWCGDHKEDVLAGLDDEFNTMDDPLEETRKSLLSFDDEDYDDDHLKEE